jgi:hypothetical protein
MGSRHVGQQIFAVGDRLGVELGDLPVALRVIVAGVHDNFPPEEMCRKIRIGREWHRY